jgi:HEAT repeat protein
MRLLDELFSGDDARAAAAARQVGEGELPALLEALQQPDPDRRWWATCALAHVPGAVPTETLIRLAADADPNVRAAALHGLGQRDTPDVIAPLLFSLTDPSEYLTRLAADALIRVGAPAVPGLARALEQDAQPRVRANAARALALIGDTAAIPALFKALEDESALVQTWAEEGLERMGVGQVYFRTGG